MNMATRNSNSAASAHHIPATDAMNVPLHLYSIEDDHDAVAHQQLRALASLGEVNHPVIALPDLHAKSRNISPTGVAVGSDHHLIPAVLDKGIGCGMRMMLTDLHVDDLSAASMDQLFEGLQQGIPAKRQPHPIVSKDEFNQLLIQGGRWAATRFNIPAQELDHIERQGNGFNDEPELQDMVTDLLGTMIPDEAMDKGRKSLGTLGGGNHFLEMQVVEDVLDENLASLLGIRPGQIAFMIHTGSQAFGSRVMRYYTQHFASSAQGKRQKHLLRKFSFHGRGLTVSNRQDRLHYFRHPFFAIRADSDEGKRLRFALRAAEHVGMVNRMIIAHHLRRQLSRVFGVSNQSTKLLFDSIHVSIQLEQINGENIWVHRHGASRALPPSGMASHPVFAKTGQPLFFPGGLGANSYLGVTTERVAQTFYSIHHGAGRVVDKPQAKKLFDESAVSESLNARQVRLYRYGISHLAEQAPQSFKNIDSVMAAAASFGLCRNVARMRPVAVLKG